MFLRSTSARSRPMVAFAVASALVCVGFSQTQLAGATDGSAVDAGIVATPETQLIVPDASVAPEPPVANDVPPVAEVPVVADVPVEAAPPAPEAVAPPADPAAGVPGDNVAVAEPPADTVPVDTVPVDTVPVDTAPIDAVVPNGDNEPALQGVPMVSGLTEEVVTREEMTQFALASAPSGQSMPVGNLAGWRQIFTDDFTTSVPVGQFPAAVSSKWGAYPSPWRDTTGDGTYSPTKVVSIGGGILNKYIRTQDGVHMVAALTPKVPGTSKYGQRYGRYAVRFRSDWIAGYKMAWMLWPDSNKSTDGEIDFPERNLDSPYVYGFTHYQGATSGSDQDWAKVEADMTQWHTAVMEWSPGLVIMKLDGREIGRTTSRVPNTAMHWVLQTETAISDDRRPPSTSRGNVQIDWVAAYAYSPTTYTGADVTAPVVSLTSPRPSSTVDGTITLSAGVSDAGGVNQVKWYVDGEEVGNDSTSGSWTDSWNTSEVNDGRHSMFVKARDNAGNWGTSPTSTFYTT